VVLEIYGLVTADIATPISALNWSTPTILREYNEEDFPHGFKKAFRWPDGQVGDALMTPVPIWFIKGAKEKILVDTSIESAEKTIALENQYALVKPEWEIKNALANIGVKPEDIDIVINTHLHDDHFANNELFTKAKFIIQKEEIPLALAPPPWAVWYFKELSRHLLQVLDRVEVVDGDKKVTDGVEVWKLGGHTPGSQAVVVETNMGKVALAGDVMYTYYNLEKHWPIGHFWDLPQLMKAYDRLKKDADVIIPNHDWTFWHRYPGGKVP